MLEKTLAEVQARLAALESEPPESTPDPSTTGIAAGEANGASRRRGIARRPPVRQRYVALAAGCLALAGIAAGLAATLGDGGSPPKTRQAWTTDLVEAAAITGVGCQNLNCSQPSRQPGGTTVAFIKSNHGPVYLADLEGPRGSGSIAVAGAGNGIRPGLSNSGRVAFQQSQGIWYTDAERKHASRLAAGFDPAWSPDGSRMAFTAEEDGAYPLFTLDVPQRGNPVMRFSDGSKTSVPAWSVDGKRIAFIRARVGDCASVRGDVWVVNSDGKNPHQLVALSGDERHPTWSPDGRRIAFSSDVADRGNYDLYTAEADGSNIVRRTSDAEDEVGPSWGPDGIVYTSGTFDCKSGGSEQSLWFLPLGG